jgi:hypothetical protein
VAVAGATGVSGRSAHTVPALLLPDLGESWRLTDLSDLVSLADGRIGGEPCYRVQGRYVPAPLDPAREEELFRLTGVGPTRVEYSPTTLWLDRDTLLVRRIEEATRWEAFRTEEVTDYQPEADVAVGDAELEFGAPDRP